ncbi:MAG: V-type ATPase subunit [Synergistaceae bacterium]|nr:V-type ATPase subunit [Synergistota bacterium]NLM70647.1 V-type ATPase subunit [Synergistaceae bacterium]
MAPAERFAYTVARLRAMSGRLLEDGLIQRMLDCEDLDSALKVLAETTYSSWLAELKGGTDFDRVIEAELLHTYEEVQKFVPDVRLVHLCRLPYDFHNVKVLVKSAILVRDGGERRFDLLTSLGVVPTDSLIMAIESEDYRLLPFGLHRLVPQCLTQWEQTKDILQVENILDAGLFSVLAELAAETGFESSVRWVKGRIDAENIRNLLRLKRMDAEAGYVASFMHEGGWLSTDKLLPILNEPVESWPRILSYSDVSGVFANVQDMSDIGAMLVDMEKVLDEYVSAVLGRAKYEAFAPENVISFLWQKELEAKNLRIALVSVANDTDRSVARRLLRHGR